VQFIKSEGVVKAVAASLLIIMFFTVYMLHPEFFLRLWYVLLCGNMQETIDYINSFGIWAMFFSFCMDVLVNALGFLPSIFISTANGVLFGIIPGVIISWLAETVGVVLSFMLMRTILRATAEKLIIKSSYLTKVDQLSSQNGFKVMLIARTIPYFPSGIITALGAVSRISFKDYVLSNLIGKFPSTALEVVIGHDAVMYQEHLARLTVVVVGVILIYSGVWFYQRKKNRYDKRKKGAVTK